MIFVGKSLTSSDDFFLAHKTCAFGERGCGDLRLMNRAVFIISRKTEGSVFAGLSRKIMCFLELLWSVLHITQHLKHLLREFHVETSVLKFPCTLPRQHLNFREYL